MHAKKIFVLLFSMLLSLSSLAEDVKSSDILGFWLSEEGTAVIEITKKDKKFEGKLVWLKVLHEGKVKEKLDDKNPDESLRSRPLLGLVNLEGFKFDDGEWEDGTIYDPKSGKTYSATMELDGKNLLKIRGYVGISLFGRTTEWTRQKSKTPDKFLNE